MADPFLLRWLVFHPCVGLFAEANKEAVATKGGIEAIVAAMQRHLEGAAGVSEQGCAALGAIASLGGCNNARQEIMTWVVAGAIGAAGVRPVVNGDWEGDRSAEDACARVGQQK